GSLGVSGFGDGDADRDEDHATGHPEPCVNCAVPGNRAETRQDPRRVADDGCAEGGPSQPARVEDPQPEEQHSGCTANTGLPAAAPSRASQRFPWTSP